MGNVPINKDLDDNTLSKIDDFLVDFNNEESERSKVMNSNNKISDILHSDLTLLCDIIFFDKKNDNIKDDIFNMINNHTTNSEEHKNLKNTFINKNIIDFYKYSCSRIYDIQNKIDLIEGMYHLNLKSDRVCKCLISQVIHISYIFFYLNSFNIFNIPYDIINRIKINLKHLIIIKFNSINREGIISLVKNIRYGKIDLNHLDDLCC